MKPSVLVFVILDHRCEPDQLRNRVFYTDISAADRDANKMRAETGCPPTAIEVVELEFAC